MALKRNVPGWERMVRVVLGLGVAALGAVWLAEGSWVVGGPGPHLLEFPGGEAPVPEGLLPASSGHRLGREPRGVGRRHHPPGTFPPVAHRRTNVVSPK